MGSGPLRRVIWSWSVRGSSPESHPALERPQEDARGLGSSQESRLLLESL